MADGGVEVDGKGEDTPVAPDGNDDQRVVQKGVGQRKQSLGKINTHDELRLICCSYHNFSISKGIPFHPYVF